MSRTKWRKYIYHDQLQFLMGCLDKRKSDPSSIRNTVPLQDSSTEENTSDCPTVEPLLVLEPPKKQRKRESAKDVESQLVELLSERRRYDGVQEEDDDRYFLLSMLPSFKLLDDEIKLKTRIEMLQVLQRSISANNQSRTESLSAIFVPKLELEEPPSPSYASSTSAPSSTVTTSIL